MTAIIISLLIYNTGFEAGGELISMIPLGKDIGNFSPTITWGSELGIRNVLPGIGFDLGVRHFCIESVASDDTLKQDKQWNGFFIDASAIFESWPYWNSFMGLRLKTGTTVSSWKMLANGKLIAISPTDTNSDTTYMKATNFGLLLGGNLMFRPIDFLIVDIGFTHRYLFSMDKDKFGKKDVDEGFLEVYLGTRFRF